MTYGPFFMPRYEKAFRFAKGDGRAESPGPVDPAVIQVL